MSGLGIYQKINRQVDSHMFENTDQDNFMSVTMGIRFNRRLFIEESALFKFYNAVFPRALKYI